MVLVCQGLRFLLRIPMLIPGSIFKPGKTCRVRIIPVDKNGYPYPGTWDDQ